MAYPTDFLDDIRARVTLESVIGRKVRLIRRGREFVALCPFHSEKTPSFTVVEEKGFYHCFGCGANGDIFRFLMDTESLSFHEAVERLAAEAGLPLPKFSREDLEKEKERASLYDVMEKAAAWFIARLHAEEGKDALAYLKNRGLKEETIRRFSIGFAPNRRTALKEFMAARGVPEKDLIATGLLIAPEDKGAPFDRFRNRVMFPITDGRGRTIAFGGRALDDQPAKYMNSPETALFHKGRGLYNLAHAVKPAREQKEIIAVEGYMDAIALAEADLENVVAPLGTALTEEQLAMLWKLAPEPALCFDGDAAGKGAALRALDRALPNLRPGVSLRFVWLPEKDDPDTLVRREGAEAFRKLIAAATPLAALLWTTLTAKAPLATPEQRAGLEKKVFETLARIPHEAVRAQYRSEFGKKLRELFRGQTDRPGRPGAFASPFRKPQLEKSRNLIKTRLGRESGEAAAPTTLEEVLIYTVLNHPKLATDHGEEFSAFHFQSEDLQKIRDAILFYVEDADSPEPEELAFYLQKQDLSGVLERHFREGHVRKIPFAQREADYLVAEKWWKRALERENQALSLRREIELLEKQVAKEDEGAWERLRSLCMERDQIANVEAFLREYDLENRDDFIN
ncbi:MAG TPA: DNA primase [Sphingomonadales bacterium]|nr:DNA primase [Sphingomonadales bacterium]